MNGANAESWSIWPAPAKLNLFLQITGRRQDGYHDLQTVFRLLHWGDRIRIRMRLDSEIVRHPASISDIPVANDLAIRAAKLLQKESKNAQGADIIVEKRIPVGGGFGGGSSDAATVLQALNCLWRLELSNTQLADLGLQLGADVPVFVHGENAWAEGIGERLTPITLPAAWYLLVDTEIHVATQELFQAAELTRDSPAATIADFVSRAVLGNAMVGNCFEPVLRRREPAVEAVFAVLTQACGSMPCAPRLTGTGSGCFVEFADRESAETVLAALPPGLKAWVVPGAERSPLLDALELEFLQGRRQEA